MGTYRYCSGLLTLISLMVSACGQSPSTVSPTPQSSQAAPPVLNEPAATPAIAAPTTTAASVPTAADFSPFTPIIPALQTQTRIPILLPTNLIQTLDLGAEPPYPIVEDVTPDRYEVQLAFDPNCQGQSACSLGTVSGEAIAPTAPAPEGQPMTLTNGITGYFVDVNPETCGAGYCYASLTWDRENARYRLELKAPTADQLVAMANAAIANPILPFTQPDRVSQAPDPQPLDATEQTAVERLFANPGDQPLLDQSFRVNLNNFGSTLFVPVAEQGAEGLNLALYLVRDDRVVYTFDPSEVSSQGMPFFDLDAIAFQDVNQDGFTDVIVIARYAPQPNATQAVSGAMVYLGDRSNRFQVDDALNQRLRDRDAKTVGDVRQILTE